MNAPTVRHHCPTPRRRARYGPGWTLAGLLAGALLACAPPTPPAVPSVVLVTLDTTRADHLGCYGYERETSPNLDQLCLQSIVYTRAYATSSWTLPTHASLFTGKFPSSHGAQYDPEGPLVLRDAIRGPENWAQIRARGLAPGERTLAAVLRENGYATGAVLGGPWLKRPFGLAAGFDFWDDSQVTTLQGARAEYVTDAAIDWIDGNEDRPFFLFLNYFDPHVPYLPPKGHSHAFLPKGTKLYDRSLTSEEQVALYDAEILYMDRHLGRLLQALKRRRLYDHTWIVVTADHGELLGEHGRFGHGRTLYEPEIRIPLLVKPPLRVPTVPGFRPQPIQQTDVMPLLLDGLGIPIPDSVQGAVPPELGHPILAEVNPLPQESSAGSWRTILDGRFKFAWNSLGDHRIYDLGQDAGEETNRLQEESARAHILAARMQRYLASLPAPEPQDGTPAEIDSETREALRAMGYLDDSAPPPLKREGAPHRP